MPSPPSGSRQVGRPALLSRERIIDAVSAMDDLNTLTMRELARQLGVSHTALYRWVKNRDELYRLIGDVLVDRVLSNGTRPGSTWRTRLAVLAWDIHDEFLALPGFASYLAQPHRINPGPTRRLREAIIDALSRSGCSPELVVQSYEVFLVSLIGWLAHTENASQHLSSEPNFEIFLDSLLRGLPVRAPGRPRPARC